MIFWCQSCGEQHTSPHVTSANITTCAKCGGSHFATWQPNQSSLAVEKLVCEAIIATQDGSSGRMVCDVEKLLAHFNSAKRAFQSPARVAEGATSVDETCLVIQRAVSDYTRRTPGHLRDCDALTGHIIRAIKNAAPQAEAGQRFPVPQHEDANQSSELAVAAPESPAKEQPGERERAAMVRWLRNPGLSSMVPGELRNFLDEAAAMIEKLGQGWIPASEIEALGGPLLTGLQKNPIYTTNWHGYWRFDLPDLPPPPERP